MNIRHTAKTAVAQTAASIYSQELPKQRDLVDDLRDEETYTLIVLDALRHDIAAEVLPEYFEGDVQEIWSAGHDTFQYGRRIWGDDIYDVRYLSAATPITGEPVNLENEHFRHLYNDFDPSEHLPNVVDIWKDEWVESVGTVPPEQVTARAQEYLDEDDLVVHYFQPHAPFIGRRPLLGYTSGKDATPRDGEPVNKPIWDGIEDGEISERELRLAYRSNLHRACKAVADLVDALPDGERIVIMGDHGESLGEWGEFGHPRVSYPVVRSTAWMEVEGTCSYPAEERGEADDSVTERLKALGYR